MLGRIAESSTIVRLHVMLGTQKLGSARNGVLSVQLGVAFRPTGMRANRTATHAAAPVELSPESIDVRAIERHKRHLRPDR